MVKGARLNVYVAMVYMAFIVTVHLTSCLGAQIKKNIYNNNGLGAYSFEYETSDGSYRREEGGLVSKGGTRYFVVRGEYGYKDSQGKKFSMTYLADANGYQPSINSDHIVHIRFNDRRII